MIKDWLNRLSGRSSFLPFDPEVPFSAIGDLHGRADILERVLGTCQNRQLVCVGDYIDRGPQSAEVLHTLHARKDIVCLSGNHEEMMLRFLDAPEIFGNRWLRFGGVQTLASFGVVDVDYQSDLTVLTEARDQLQAAMGRPLLNWMRQLPKYWQSGNVAVVHAGADPNIPINEQTVANLHWGHHSFLHKQRNDGVWVIHGHTIVSEPLVHNGRIAIDTGAYLTGRLTIANVEQNSLSFRTFS